MNIAIQCIHAKLAKSRLNLLDPIIPPDSVLLRCPDLADRYLPVPLELPAARVAPTDISSGLEMGYGCQNGDTSITSGWKFSGL